VRVRAILVVFLLAVAASRLDAQMLVAAGDPSPLGPLSRFSDPAVDDGGRVAFVGSSVALFQRSGAGLVHLIAAGDQTPDGRIADIDAPSLGGSCTAARLLLVGGGAGVYRLCSGSLEAIARAGDAAPGGGTFRAFSAVFASAGGRVAFVGQLDGGATGVFVSGMPGAGAPVARVAVTGDPSPAGGTFGTLRLLGVTDDGRVGFRAFVDAGPDGLFRWDGASVVKVVVVNEASPVGGRFTAVGFGTLNDAGVWTFRASISDGDRSGVFRAVTTGPFPVLTPVALEGDPTPIGGNYKAFASTLVPAVNASGAIAFRATVSKELFSAGVFLATPDGPVGKVLAAGESTAAGRLAQFRDPALANDGGVLVAATLIGGSSGLFRVRAGAVSEIALPAMQTDLGVGFRFAEPSVRDAAESGVFLGLRDGVFVTSPDGSLCPVATLGQATPAGGVYDGFESPAAGSGGQIVFGATVQTSAPERMLFGVSGCAATVLVKPGGRAPAPCGGRFDDFLNTSLDAATSAGVGPGGFAFLADLVHTHRRLAVIVRSGRRFVGLACAQQAAIGGGRYAEFGTPTLLARRQAAFVARVDGHGPSLRLIVRGGGRTRLLASGGDDTGTRLGGHFASLDSPAGGSAGVAFHATLDTHGREGLFLARPGSRGRGALAGTGDAAPGGGKFTGFGAPVLAGGTVVFDATVVGGPSAEGIFRVPATLAAQTDPPLAVEGLALVGGASPAGGTYVSLGGPAANASGLVAFTADLTGATASRALFRVP